jgi:hypothetical protein
MHERASTRPRIFSPLQLFALVTITGAIFLNTARYIDLFSNTPEPEEVASIAEVPPAPNKPSVRVVARAEMQSTKPESATTQVRVQPPDELPALEDATTAETAAKNKKPLRAQAKGPASETGSSQAHIYRATAARSGTAANKIHIQIGRPASAYESAQGGALTRWECTSAGWTSLLVHPRLTYGERREDGRHRSHRCAQFSAVRHQGPHREYRQRSLGRGAN